MCSVVVLSSRAVCVVCSDGSVLYVPVLRLYTQGPRTVCVMKVVCVCLTVSMIVLTYMKYVGLVACMSCQIPLFFHLSSPLLFIFISLYSYFFNPFLSNVDFFLFFLF